MARTKKNENMVKGNAVRMVLLDELQVDPSYQRGLNRTQPDQIAENYDPIAFGTPVVGEREDGTKWVVDGQQRIQALRVRNEKKIAGGNPHKWVRCEVFASRGPEHEASIFKKINKDRVRLEPLQLYHAMLTAGDEHCWKIKETAAEYGFTIPKGNPAANRNKENRASQLICVNALSRCLVRGGPETLNFVLSVIRDCWPTDPLRTKSEIVNGLRVFYARHDKTVDLERLVPRLNTTTPHKILYSAGLGVSDAAGNIADVIEKLYRKRVVRS